MHDSGGGAVTHDISMPLVLSKDPGFELQAKSFARLSDVNWNTVPVYDTYWVKQAAMPHFYYDWLKSGAHPGAGGMETKSCGTFQKDGQSLPTGGVLE